MAVAFVQEVAKDGTSSTQSNLVGTLGIGITTTVGNRLIMRWFANQTVSSIVDSKGNTWQVDVSQSPSFFYGIASAAITSALVPGDTITVHLAGATSFHTFVVDEWSGVAGFGAAGTVVAVSTTTARTTNAVTGPSGALVMGVWAGTANDTTFTPDAGAGWTGFHTPMQLSTNSQDSIEGEYKLSSGSSLAPDATGVSGPFGGFAAYYIAAGTVPVNSVAPTVSGTTTDGSTLTSTTGTWSNSPTDYAYQWTRDGANIAAATSSTYLVQLADRGHVLRCVVTASNGSGAGGAAVSSNSIIATAPAVPALGPLKYAPPDQRSPITIDLTGTPGDYFQTLTPGADYIVKLSASLQRTGQIGLDANGARSVKIIGGLWALQDGGTKNYHIHIVNLMGWAFIEGQEADMANTQADFLDVSGGSTYQPTVYFQNSRIINLTATDATNHADVFQPQGMIGRVYVDKLTFSSNYQGFTMYQSPNQLIASMRLSRVNCWYSTANATNPITYLFWLNNANGSANNDSLPYGVTFDDVWGDLTRGAGRGAYSGEISTMIYPSKNSHGTGAAGGGTLPTGGSSPFSNGEVIGAQDEPGHTYATVTNTKMKIGGKLNSGSPSTGRSDVVTDIDGLGSFVPAGIGSTYNTPGYLPRPRSGVLI